MRLAAAIPLRLFPRRLPDGALVRIVAGPYAHPTRTYCVAASCPANTRTPTRRGVVHVHEGPTPFPTTAGADVRRRDLAVLR